MINLTRILIADDHPVVREGLTNFLIPRNGVEIVGQATNRLEAVQLARELQPDVILMDLIMSELNGVEATAQIRTKEPDARILVLTSFGNEEMLSEALNAGAMGCLLKDSEPEVLLQAIRNVNQGQFSLPPNLVLKLLNHLPQNTKTTSLTKRERQVMQVAGKGFSSREIAGQLDIGENTVRSHISSILRKLNLANRTQLAIYMLEEKKQTII